MDSAAHETELDELLEQLVHQVELDSAFDVEAFLRKHPQHAAELELRLKRLQRIGVVRSASAEGRTIRRLRERFGVDLAPKPLATGSAKPGSGLGSTAEEPGVAISSMPVDVDLGDRYRVLGVLGIGGMGRVLRALDMELGREVAVKVIRAPQLLDSPSPQTLLRLSRFVSEAQTTSQLEHPNIVPVYDFGLTADGEPFFTMKVVRGRTLHEIIQALTAGDPRTLTTVTLRRKLEIIQRICDGLAFAHAHGVVHRDLKPGNVMVGDFGEVQVMDWGLARSFQSETGSQPRGTAARLGTLPQDWLVRTQSGDRLGSPAYMSPEQARGEIAAIDALSDVFGVGAILYHLLSGRPPRDGRDREEVLIRAAAGRLDDPQMHRCLWPVPSELKAVCRKALSPEKQERYQSVQELTRDLAAYLEDRSGSAWTDAPPALLRKVIRRRPLATAMVSSVVVIGLLALLLGVEARRVHDQDLDLLIGRTRAVIPTLSDFDESKILNSTNADYAGLCQGFLAKLSAVDSRLDLLGDSNRFLETYVEIREQDPNTALDLRLELYQLAHYLYLSGAFHLWQESVGQIPVRNPNLSPSDQANTLAHRAETAKYHPELVPLWPRLCATLESTEDDPWRREAWHARLDWITSAVDRFDPVIAQSKERSGRDLTWLASLVRGARPPQATLPILENAAKLDSRSYDTQFQLARTYGLSSEVPEHVVNAVLHGEIAVAMKPKSAWAWTNLGKAHIDLAIQYNKEYVKFEHPDPEDTQVAWLLANVEREKSKAIACYRRAIDINPNVAVAHSNLANMLVDPAEHEYHLHEALRAEPENAVVLSNYAGFMAGLGCDSEAVALWTRLGRVRPLYLGEEIGLGRSALALARSGGTADAESYAQSCLDIAVDALVQSADRDFDWFWGAWAAAASYMERGDCDHALDWLEWFLDEGESLSATDRATLDESLVPSLLTEVVFGQLRSPPDGAPWGARARGLFDEIEGFHQRYLRHR